MKDKKINYKKILKDIIGAISASVLTLLGILGMSVVILAYIPYTVLLICSFLLSVTIYLLFIMSKGFSPGYITKAKEETPKKKLLKYSFTNNSILLTMDTINKNGFFEIWRQENEEKSIQILCFNEQSKEFQAFDKFHRMEESTELVWEGVPYKFDEEELWTPIEFHYTLEWFQAHNIKDLKGGEMYA